VDMDSHVLTEIRARQLTPSTPLRRDTTASP
jgi:hypothetical protein